MVRPVRIKVLSRTTGESTDYEFHNSPIRVGRNRLNDLPLPYPFVSGWHAVIRFDDQQARFFDLGSTNGTLFHGRRVQVGESVAFEEATTVQLGDIDLVMSRSASSTSVVPARSGSTAPGTASASGTYMQAAQTAAPSTSGTIDDTGGPPQEAPQLHANQTAHVPMRQIHAALAALRPYHEAQARARIEFEQQLRVQLAALPQHIQIQAEEFIRREFGIAEGSGNAPSPQPGGAAMTGVDNVAALSEQLLPTVPPPMTSEEVQRFLGCVRDVLEVCAKGLVELQSGQEQFGREMGVRAIKEFTPLHVAASSRDVLDHLLDFRHGGRERVSELAGVFADTMIHQVALLNGVAAGGRALLARLDPDEIERELASGWGRKSSAKWDRFIELYRSIVAEDRVLTEMLFGPEFARAYAEVGGEQVDMTAAERNDDPTY